MQQIAGKDALHSVYVTSTAGTARPLGFPHIEGDIMIRVGGAFVFATARRCLS